MTLRTYLVIGLALIFGITSAMGISILVNQPNMAHAAETATIVVARGDIVRFVPLTESQLELKSVPKEMVPPGAVTSVADALDRASHVNLAKNDYVLDHLLTKKGTKTVASVIPPGKCAYVVKGSNVSSFVQPGDRVDVILTIKEKSATVLTMIDVLAVNGSIMPTLESKSDGKEPSSVELVLTQEEARQLEEGKKKGMLGLTLRNIGDLKPAQTTRIEDLIEKETPLPVPVPEKKIVPEQVQPQQQEPMVIRTIRGTIESVHPLPAPPGNSKPN